MSKARIVTVSVMTLVLVIAGVFIAFSFASGNKAASTAKTFATDDAVGYLGGKDMTKRPIDGKALVVQFNDQRQIAIDLQPRHKGMINIMTSAGGEGRPIPMQRLVIEPSGSNMIALGTELLQSDGTTRNATQQLTNDADAPARKTFIVDAHAMGYFNGEHSQKKPLQAELVLIELGEMQRFLIDLREPGEDKGMPREGRVIVIGGGLGANDQTASQLLQIEPSGANGIYLRTSDKLK